MNELLIQFRSITADLDRLRVRYALVGGMALSLRIEPRFTRDLDIAVAVKSDEEAEALSNALLTRGYRVFAQLEHETTGRLATVRLVLPETRGIVLDLLFASCGIESEVVDAAERIEALPGWSAPVARPEHLLAMKLLASDAGRPQDMVDARALIDTMNHEQIERTREALGLIEQRGYNRRKNLADELDRVLRKDRCD